jgi:hypothetical protein
MRILAATAAALLLAAAPSSAKTVCGQLGDPDGRFYVLFKVKTKHGALGPVVGYFVTQAGTGTPFSGHYSVPGEGVLFVTSTDGSGTSGFGSGVNLRNWSAPISADAANGTHFGAAVNGQNEAVTEITSTSTSFEDCKNVPKFAASN